MERMLNIGLAMIILAVTLSCGPKVMVPPKINLKKHEIVGIVEFEFSEKGELGPLTTKKFMRAVRKDQELVRIVELGTEAEILEEIGQERLNQDAFKAVGDKYDVVTVFTGELIISDVRPDVKIAPGLGFMNFRAEVDATLSAQLTETSTGASIWSSSVSSTKKLGQISVFGGDVFDFNADDPDEAYSKLVDDLVKKASKDFRVTWKRK